MKNLNILLAALIAISISAPVAASNDDDSSASKMPMMGHGYYGHMMTPEQMEEMQEMMSSGQIQQMPMMNPQMMTPEQMQQMQEMMSSGQVQQMPMMNPQMMHMMMHGMAPMGYSHPGMPMMGQGMGPGMMNPQMMQMHMQHMADMATHLQRIEALLEELVELQKAE